VAVAVAAAVAAAAATGAGTKRLFLRGELVSAVTTLDEVGSPSSFWSLDIQREEVLSMSAEASVLRRSKNSVIAGVCGGIAEKTGWPPNRVRLGYVLLTILSAAFPGILVYIILWIVMPGPND
jgi:phage shock protein PspC (stress-responsive transcriptional regulator)